MQSAPARQRPTGRGAGSLTARMRGGWQRTRRHQHVPCLRDAAHGALALRIGVRGHAADRLGLPARSACSDAGQPCRALPQVAAMLQL